MITNRQYRIKQENWNYEDCKDYWNRREIWRLRLKIAIKEGKISVRKAKDKDHIPMVFICNGMVGLKKPLLAMKSEVLGSISEINDAHICKSMFEKFNDSSMITKKKSKSLDLWMSKDYTHNSYTSPMCNFWWSFNK